jgi:hypothetical protein
MSPQVAEQLEQKLEREGTLDLTPTQLTGLFDFRAHNLVGMSGEEALEQIRSGKCDSSPEWSELALFSSLIP